jgi:hypothetical protein
MLKPRILVAATMMLIAAATRLFPHPANFAPITAIALFGGATLYDKRLAFGVPLLAMLLSDAFIGFHDTMPFVYGSFALIVCIGMVLRTRRGLLPLAGAASTSSILFFVITNFGVWTAGSIYPKSFPGLVACYVAAVPFFQNTLFGDAVYTAALFGGLAIAEARFPMLRTQDPNPLRQQ